MPPTIPADVVGACTSTINPNGTGCIIANGYLDGGSFLRDNHEVVAIVTYGGAPSSPDPAAIYTGQQIILIKTDGTTFSNGDPWKCLTCGTPASNMANVTIANSEYPQSFPDGSRLLIGNSIFDCSPYQLTDDACTASQIYGYPIRFNNTPDGSGPGASIRELRLHPDGVHLGLNVLTYAAGVYNEYAYYGHLVFNPAPTTGLPLAPRYDLTNVSQMVEPGFANRTLTVNPTNPHQLLINTNGIDVGEFRGFSKDGTEAFYVGYPHESSNIDVFAANMTTGAVRDVTEGLQYNDPLDSSPDDQWVVALATTPYNRLTFVAGMQGVPPLVDPITTALVAGMRSNQGRAFWKPILLDRYAGRGSYVGQQINAGDTSPGGIDDPNWDAAADPRWSWDETAITYYEHIVQSPGCGGTNPLPCPTSTEPGGRTSRIMIAHLTSRTPYAYTVPAPTADNLPTWGVPYVPGSAPQTTTYPPAGHYFLYGAVSGVATVEYRQNSAGTIDYAHVKYTNFSNDGVNLLNGTEHVDQLTPGVTKWKSRLEQLGNTVVLKRTSPELQLNTISTLYYNNFQALSGKLETKIGGVTYNQPANGT